MEEMQRRLPDSSVAFYVSQRSLDALRRSVGLPSTRDQRRDSGGEEDEVEEAVELQQGNWAQGREKQHVTPVPHAHRQGAGNSRADDKGNLVNQPQNVL